MSTQEEEDPTSTLHKCRCCLQTFPTHLELLVHSFIHSRWDKVRIREEGEPDEEEEEGLDGGGLKMDIKVEEEGPALSPAPWPSHVRAGQDGATDNEPGDGHVGREGLETPGDSQRFQSVKSEEEDDNTNKAQAIELRRFSIVVDPIAFCPKCSKPFVTKQELKEHEREEHTGGNVKDHASPRKKVEACALCGKAFSNRRNLRCHWKEHPEEESLRCKHCERVFSNWGGLSVHVRLQTCQKSSTCGQCNKTFSSHKHLSVHAAVHSDDRPFKCDVCNKSFKYRNYLQQHKKDHTGEGLKEDLEKLLGYGIRDTFGEGSGTGASLRCLYCSKILATRGGLIDHIRVYHIHDTEAYTCGFCYEKFNSKSRLNVHKKKTHNIGEMYRCKHCGKDCLKKSALAAHEQSHTGEKPFKCSLCSMHLSSETTLKRHKLLVHSDETPFICDKCGKGFKISQGLKNHMKEHGIHPKEQHACKHCPKVLTSKYTLENHMRSFHGADRSKHNCPDCSRKYPSYSTLCIHRRKVHGYKTRRNEDHKCSICNQVLFWKSKLEIHVRRHTGETPFRCVECCKGFTSRGLLKAHMLVHATRHSCPYCSYKIAKGSLLQHHIRTLHPDKQQHECNSCGKIIQTCKGLVHHLQRCQLETDERIEATL